MRIYLIQALCEDYDDGSHDGLIAAFQNKEKADYVLNQLEEYYKIISIRDKENVDDIFTLYQLQLKMIVEPETPQELTFLSKFVHDKTANDEQKKKYHELNVAHMKIMEQFKLDREEVIKHNLEVEDTRDQAIEDYLAIKHPMPTLLFETHKKYKKQLAFCDCYPETVKFSIIPFNLE